MKDCLDPRRVQSTPSVKKQRQTRERAMSGTEKSSTTRRNLLQAAATGGAATALLGGLGVNPSLAAAARSEKPLKAAFSNAGLQATWCAQGKQAAEWWGKLFNVEVTWFDGQLDAVKQRAAIDNMASQKWDFVAIQAFGIGTLTQPVQKMIDAGTPVIDMDTLIAPLDQINVHSFLAPDNEFMGASVTQALFFFSSRRRHTSSLCDWSSDVCSSDLIDVGLGWRAHERASQPHPPRSFALARDDNLDHSAAALPVHRRDGAVVLGHDLLCDRESESAAAGAAAEERLEYVREVGGGEAGSVLRGGEEQRAGSVGASVGGDVGAGRGDVDRVLDDALEHLQHAVGVDRCLGESAVDVL